MDALEVKKSLAGRALDFASYLFPNGKRKGNDLHVGNINGEPGDSFRICINGGKTGVFRDFASDVGGDNLLELLIQARNLEFKDALAQAREWLGYRGESVRATAREYKKPSRSGLRKIAEPVELYLMGRGISQKVIREYKVATDDKENIVIPYLTQDGELEMIKFISMGLDANGKKIIRTNEGAKKTLMGKHLFDKTDRVLIITEGEIDAFSWREAGRKACSVPFGAKWKGADGRDPNDEWIENDWNFLQDFERIYLSFDMDEQGQKARDCIIERLGIERCWMIDLPKKDANQVLTEDGAKALLACYDGAKQKELENLRNAAHYSGEVEDSFFPKDESEIAHGIPMPWKLSGGDFHWRMNEVTIITGFNGSGKTVLLNWLTLHFAKYDRRTFVASLEVRPVENIKVLVNQCVGDLKPESPSHLHAAMQFLAGHFWYFDHQGQVNRKELLRAMEYCYRRYGTTIFVIDSLMKLGLAADDWNGQKKALDDLTDFANKWPVHIFLVAHSKKKDDEATRSGKMDVKGAGEITDMAHNVWTVFRNKKKERTIRALKEKGGAALMEAAKVDSSTPDCYFSCDKQRNGLGNEPECKLWFGVEAKQFHDQQSGPEIIIPVPSDNDGASAVTESLPQPTTHDTNDDATPF